MSLVAKLIGFGFRQTLGAGVGQAAEIVVGAVEQHFADHSEALPKALAKANDRAWQALSIALAGDGFLDKIKVFFASGDDRGIHEQVRLFLQDKNIAIEGTSADFRKRCLDELNQAKKAGLLTAQNLSPKDVARQTANFQRYADPKGMVDGAEQVMAQIADELAADFPNLAKLLRERPYGGPPLLVSAFAYFFRREVETNRELAHGLFFDGLRQLSASQATAFGEVNKALASLGDQFEQVFQQLGRIETVVVETHCDVLDIKAEMQNERKERREQHEQVLALLKRGGIQRGEVKPQDSLCIRSAEEREAVKQHLARFRQRSAEQQKQAPALLYNLGKLQYGIRDFKGATESFMAVAAEVHDASAQAEAQFNAYRSALEEKRFDMALAAIQKAAVLDSQRFAPFPMQRYQPKQILGAGGFGTAFLCHDRNFDEEVVVKTLHDAAMERNMADVFREARLLRKLNHPAIIGVQDCEYADPKNKLRPYIVMDYFPGGNLATFVEQRGTLSPAWLVEIARQVAQGMQAAHQQNILHRDLKPDNVLVRKEGDSWTVKIIDFGLAFRHQTIETSKAGGLAGNNILADSVAGTIKYAPPEQMGELQGVRPGPYSDVYSFGKLCCFTLFKTTDPLRSQWNNIPNGLADLLEKCLEPDTKLRLPNFESVLKVLESLDPIPTKQERKQREIITNSLGMKFAWIPPGTFLMGSPKEEQEREANEVPHKVTLSKGFYMGVYPVTQEQWQAVMDDIFFALKLESEEEKDLPVENVSWEDCQTFIKKLRKRDKKAYRLPTEAEWEYACRAGKTTPFHFGNTISTEQVNYDGNYTYGNGKKGVYRQKTTPVGSFPANAFGLYDMHGNVWEWCRDWFGAYPPNDVLDPQGPDAGKSRVLRGGCWRSGPAGCRSAFRFGSKPGDRSDIIGFRLCVCPD